MSTEVYATLVSSLFGGILVALVNQMSSRKKSQAEIEKIKAEAEKIKAETTKLLSDMDFEGWSEKESILPQGWFKAGSRPEDYEMGLDYDTCYTGTACGFIKGKRYSRGFGTLMQTFSATRYLGQRVRMSGYVQTENVVRWSSLWMRVDGEEKSSLSFDNMKNRSIDGSTQWQKYSIVLDIPEESKRIAFGFLLEGQGQMWVDKIHFEIVGQDVPVTDLKVNEDLKQDPINLSFEEAQANK